ERPWPFAVVAALAQPEIEAWCVAIWVPENDREQAACDGERRRLGFDPTLHPHDLSSGSGPKDAKSVLACLTASGRTADERWADFPLDRAARTSACGLQEFVTSFGDRVSERPR